MNDAVTFGAQIAGTLVVKSAQSPSRGQLLGATAPTVNAAGLPFDVADSLKWRNTIPPPEPAAKIDPSVAAWGRAPYIPGAGLPREAFQPNSGWSWNPMTHIRRWQDNYVKNNPLPAHAKYVTQTPEERRQTLYETLVEQPKQTLQHYGKVMEGFRNGFRSKVNPVVRFVDEATDPNIGLSGATSNAVASAQKSLGLEKQPPQPPPPPPRPATAVAKDYFGGLKGWAGKNQMLALGLALGLGGLGAYGLYDLLRSRRRRNRPRYYDYDAREF